MNALTVIALVLTITHLVVSSSLELRKEVEFNPAGQEEVINYLVQYGYIEKAKVYSQNYVQEGLKKLQTFFKLPVTGVVDLDVLELIKKPRCGVPDIFNNRTKYVVGSEGFDKKHLTYMFGRYTWKVPRRDVDESVALALQMWGKHAHLSFSEVGSNPDLMLDFVPKNHNDNYPFDGPHGILAHAFYPIFPGYAGDVHFDEEEPWNIVTPSNPDGYDFFSVAIHELGHSLGLSHSEDASAVMYPTYQYIDKKRGLADDDMRGIYYIYGEYGNGNELARSRSTINTGSETLPLMLKKMNAVTIALVLTISHLVVSSPIELRKEPELKVSEQEQVINYLVRYGYMEKAKTYNQNLLHESIKKLQTFFKLPVTGVVDADVLELMKKPRCGVPDIITSKNKYNIASEPFKKKHITYKFGTYSPKLNNDAVDADVKLALEMWAVNSSLTFSKVDIDPDILLDFMPRSHGDLYPFDGPGGVLAHAFYPPTYLSGDLHLDEEEDWQIMTSSSSGTDFFSVVLHELGHSLGLGHSNLRRAVMFPSYRFVDKKRGLEQDDKLGIYTLYARIPIQAVQAISPEIKSIDVKELERELLPRLVDALKAVFALRKDSTEEVTSMKLTLDINRKNKKRKDDQRTPPEEKRCIEGSQPSFSQQKDTNMVKKPRGWPKSKTRKPRDESQDSLRSRSTSRESTHKGG
ncbi:hypothetical protein RN001_011465 [Aquatica leii]|uniref:Peptidase metallopeptidase domain-containing protein n=1 Tax=Aquatica leii TaxID=1421715 RepID=A0AAN7QDW0_9COLE|nr:hypothetical protein RN001_011465 [Aquatica leii]